MKYQEGDKIIVLLTNEAGKVVEIMNEKCGETAAGFEIMVQRSCESHNKVVCIIVSSSNFGEMHCM